MGGTIVGGAGIIELEEEGAAATDSRACAAADGVAAAVDGGWMGIEPPRMSFSNSLKKS